MAQTNMNILVTGGAGYLGSLLLPKLISRGHKVKVLDIGYFGIGHLRPITSYIELIREDIRKIISRKKSCDELLSGCDCIIHLAALSNDPSSDLNPELTEEVNTKATFILGEVARKKGIKFLFSSSCSIYGETNDEIDENGKLEPLTTYAKSKVNAEKALLSLSDNTWKATILRSGTLFGYSTKMRFDLVVNIFSLYSTLYNEIKVFGEGLQWRPFIHVKDAAKAFVYFTEKENLNHSCYNIAHKNLRVIDIVPIFQSINPNLRVTNIKTEKEDKRNYKVKTFKIREEGFKTTIDIGFGAEEIIEAIISGIIPDPESIYYQNAKWLKELNPEIDPQMIKNIDLWKTRVPLAHS